MARRSCSPFATRCRSVGDFHGYGPADIDHNAHSHTSLGAQPSGDHDAYKMSTLAASKAVVAGGVGQMLELARTQVRNVPVIRALTPT